MFACGKISHFSYKLGAAKIRIAKVKNNINMGKELTCDVIHPPVLHCGADQSFESQG